MDGSASLLQRVRSRRIQEEQLAPMPTCPMVYAILDEPTLQRAIVNAQQQTTGGAGAAQPSASAASSAPSGLRPSTPPHQQPTAHIGGTHSAGTDGSSGGKSVGGGSGAASQPPVAPTHLHSPLPHHSPLLGRGASWRRHSRMSSWDDGGAAGLPSSDQSAVIVAPVQSLTLAVECVVNTALVTVEGTWTVKTLGITNACEWMFALPISHKVRGNGGDVEGLGGRGGGVR